MGLESCPFCGSEKVGVAETALGNWVYDTNYIYMHSFVTHWMPLPEPPKEE